MYIYNIDLDLDLDDEAVRMESQNLTQTLQQS